MKRKNTLPSETFEKSVKSTFKMEKWKSDNPLLLYLPIKKFQDCDKCDANEYCAFTYGWMIRVEGAIT